MRLVVNVMPTLNGPDFKRTACMYACSSLCLSSCPEWFLFKTYQHEQASCILGLARPHTRHLHARIIQRHSTRVLKAPPVASWRPRSGHGSSLLWAQLHFCRSLCSYIQGERRARGTGAEPTLFLCHSANLSGNGALVFIEKNRPRWYFWSHFLNTN